MTVRFRTLAVAGIALLSLLAVGVAQAEPNKRLSLELNTVQDVSSACRMTFVARNATEASIEKAVFETVIFDQSGRVVSLKLFDFKDIPADRPRVRQFDVANMSCEELGQALINGVNSCIVDGSDSDLCLQALTLSSRTDVELLG